MPIQNWQNIQVSQLREARRKLGITGGGGVVIQGSGASVVTSGTLQFANSNGVTFGIAGQTMTASIAAAPAAGIGGISAGTQLATSGTVLFQNSNGITFGMSNTSVITASHDGITSQSVQTQGSVLINGSSGSIVLSNSNNVSFGGNASTITATATFSQSVQTQGSVLVQGSSGSIVFSNSNNVSFGGNASTITASASFSQTIQTQGSVLINGSSGAISISGSELASVSNNASTVIVSVRSMSLHENQNPTQSRNFNMGTRNIGFQFNGVGTNPTFDGAFEIDAIGGFSGDLLHVHQHGGGAGPGDMVHIECEASDITAMRIQGGASVLCEISNSVTGMPFKVLHSNATVMCESLNVEMLNGRVSSYFAVSNHTHGALALTNLTGTSASNGLSLSAAAPGAATAVISLNGSTGSLTISAGNNISISNNNSIINVINLLSSTQTVLPVATTNSVGTMASHYAMADHQHAGVANFSVGGNTSGNTTSGALSNVVLLGGPNITLSGATAPGGILSLSISAGAGAAGVAGIAAAGSTVTNGTVLFSNANNITFGLAGSTMTASIVQYPDELNLAGNTSGTTVFDPLGPTLIIAGGSNVTVEGYATNAFSIHGLSRFPTAVVDGFGNSITSGQVRFNPANGVTFGINGQTITASVATGASAAQTISAWPLIPNPGHQFSSLDSATTAAGGGSTQITGIGHVHSYPFPHELHLHNLEMLISGTHGGGTGSATLGVQLGFYTLNGNTVLSKVTDFQWGMLVSQSSSTANSYHWWWGTDSNANTSQASGAIKSNFVNPRVIVLNATPATIPAGNYYVAVLFSHRTSSASASLFQSLAYFTGGQTTTHGSKMGTPGWTATGFMGTFSISTNTNVIINGLLLPNALETSLINTTNQARMFRPYWVAYRTGT